MAYFCERVHQSSGESYQAFVPTTIGADFSCSEQVIARFTKLDELIKSVQNVDGEGINDYLLRYSAGGSALRDGRSVSRKRLALIGANVPRMDIEARSILMHSDAFKQALSIGCEQTKFDVEALKAMASPMKNDKGNAGQFRKGQGWIGGTSPLDAYYVCPPVELVEPLIENLCDFINRDDIPASLQAAIAHVQLSIIHPLSDGNGRTARALVEVILRRRGVVTTIAPPVFLYRLILENNDYVAAIKDFEQESHDALYNFWCSANEWAVKQIVALQQSKQQFTTSCFEQFKRAKIARTPQLNNLIEALFTQPIVTQKWLARYLSVSEDQALVLLNLMRQAGVCQTHKLREPKDFVIWDAATVFKLLNEFDKGLFEA